jgi:DNA polymerase III subunit epsilon
VRGLTGEPDVLLEPLAARMRSLSGAERFEEAADMRDRAAALADAIRRQRRLDALRRAGRLVVEVPGQGGAVLDGGRLLRAWGPEGAVAALDLEAAPDPAPPSLPLARHLADEVACVAAWLDREAHRIRVLECEGELSSATGLVPRFEPRQRLPAAPAAAKVLVRTPR